MPWNNVVTRLVAPYVIFIGLFVFSKHQIGGYLCDCFANSYEKITVDITASVFLIGSIIISYEFKDKKKEWRFLHTFLFIILFFVTFYAVMAIGDYFYVGTSGKTF